ncbi:MAG: flippase-like domain-containing protein [Flavobacteriales bacterium]|nr:flippase-like domain-containing protein [Flavobacteriales bacterium]
MKEKLISVLKVVLPLGIGVFVIWYQFTQLSDKQLHEIKDSFAQADYFWVILSVSFGILSHLSRAYRWKYTLQPLGYKTRFINNFFGVMIGYVANIVLPRFGEVWRCVMVSRYEKLSFEKVFGTVVAERVADMVVLILIIAAVVVMQLNQLRESISKLLSDFMSTNSPTDLAWKFGGLGLLAILGAIIGWRVLTRSQNPIVLKVRNLLRGLTEGITSILKMKQKWAFLAHTAFIWAMYLAMYYAPFLALPETSTASISAVLASFVMASFSIVLVQGGIGVYPVAVAQTLTLYAIHYEAGFAMGWIIWVAQTIMIVTLGVLSLLLMPLFNSGTKPLEANE